MTTRIRFDNLNVVPAGHHRYRCLRDAVEIANILTFGLLLLLIGLLFTGCASVPKDYPRTESTAFKNYQDTSMGQQFEEAAQQHPGDSGFAIIRNGRQAFTARIETKTPNMTLNADG